jgi:hypothetical protein
MNPPQIEVTISGHNHPHNGEKGIIKVVDGKLQRMKIANLTLWLVVLENCPHGVAESYVLSTQMRFAPKYEKKFQELYSMLYGKDGEI